MHKRKSQQIQLVNPDGFTYKSWKAETKDLLAKLYGLDIDQVYGVNPQDLWEANISVGNAVAICVGSLPNPLEDETDFFSDDFAGYEFNQTFSGESV